MTYPDILGKLASIPSVEVMRSNSPYFLFRCPDPISLGLLSNAIYEAGLSWKIEVQSSEDDPRIPLYHLLPIGNGKASSEETELLEEVLTNVTQTRLACRADDYTPEGIPDLGLVTVGQMFNELSNRNIDYVAIWGNGGQTNFKALGPSILLLGMLRKAEHWIMNDQDF